ncbi:CDP-glucose 4,6-dehydratase [Hyphomicrobium sp.]|uniref:CDP-glucose 4,6-dehydratase n=1 Tax=Hyphomicrobium sp. TaxID=82 RepID=UPI0025C53CAA|nr:CDP-glucose 4,6-dehydratase [Hyphomicrobium sp.]MCC7251815.1 CDP-glucose 4,6-dehydratase [Hyphomicrobium sp.]
MELDAFWRGRRVLVTGHTGFKGAWLCLWLEKLGAVVSAVALAPETHPSLYEKLAPWRAGRHHVQDIRDGEALRARMRAVQPEIVLHMAAQALVRPSYDAPADTFATNVMGTVHVLEAVRACPSVRAVLVITSDKVYANDGGGRPFVETDRLGGHDPYSASKTCAEIVCHSYRVSFLDELGVRLATARAGNVIGGGDWAKDRLSPDFVRALDRGAPLLLRYPHAVRPWQHVLEPLSGYLRFAQALTEDRDGILPEAFNFGPDAACVATVSELAEAFAAAYGVENAWMPAAGLHPHEAATLGLSSARARGALGWRPRLTLRQTVDWTADWYKADRNGADMRAFSLDQIAAYEQLAVSEPRAARAEDELMVQA